MVGTATTDSSLVVLALPENGCHNRSRAGAARRGCTPGPSLSRALSPVDGFRAGVSTTFHQASSQSGNHLRMILHEAASRLLLLSDSCHSGHWLWLQAARARGL